MNSRRNAAFNDRAVYREPMTMDDYLEARPVSDPFGLLDCDVPIDGSIAIVVSSPSTRPTARTLRCAWRRSVRRRGAAAGGTSVPTTRRWRRSKPPHELWSRTDLTPADVDIAELYDGFTFLTLGVARGARVLRRRVRAARSSTAARGIALDGDLPLNTYGGQLSAGRMHGYWVLHEACLQLRGEAGERQVDGAEVAAVSVGGGPIAGCILLTR